VAEIVLDEKTVSARYAARTCEDLRGGLFAKEISARSFDEKTVSARNVARRPARIS
jgi:hypothetical protein